MTQTERTVLWLTFGIASVTRRPSYLDRPMGPGTPGVAWDAEWRFDGWLYECGPLRKDPRLRYWVGLAEPIEVCVRAERLARRLARRKGKDR